MPAFYLGELFVGRLLACSKAISCLVQQTGAKWRHNNDGFSHRKTMCHMLSHPHVSVSAHVWAILKNECDRFRTVTNRP
jgi:hypothetical protein